MIDIFKVLYQMEQSCAVRCECTISIDPMDQPALLLRWVWFINNNNYHHTIRVLKHDIDMARPGLDVIERRIHEASKQIYKMLKEAK